MIALKEMHRISPSTIALDTLGGMEVKAPAALNPWYRETSDTKIPKNRDLIIPTKRSMAPMDWDNSFIRLVISRFVIIQVNNIPPRIEMILKQTKRQIMEIDIPITLGTAR